MGDRVAKEPEEIYWVKALLILMACAELITIITTTVANGIRRGQRNHIVLVIQLSSLTCLFLQLPRNSTKALP